MNKESIINHDLLKHDPFNNELKNIKDFPAIYQEIRALRQNSNNSLVLITNSLRQKKENKQVIMSIKKLGAKSTLFLEQVLQ
ncbi:MAG: hypothetical protein ACTSRA_03250 [Promethearchaeota archaeon]